MFIKPFAQFFVHQLFDVALDVAVQLALGLPFELRLWQTHTDHGDQSFANVVAGDAHFVFLFLQHSGVGRKIVDGARQRGAKAGEVGAAINSVDGVRKSENVFAVRIVVLQSDLDLHVSFFALNVYRRIVQRGLAAVQMFNEFGDAAGKAEFRRFFRALIG